jgi:hypothetical protein
MGMSISPASPDNESIKKIADYAEKQDKVSGDMVKLTRYILYLTIVMAIIGIVQIVKLFV